jgi:catechol 2,3-dioxygenase-like lactoylglutathione lyase family enzyme
MIAGIRHTGLVVANMEESLKFWCDLLGFKVFKIMEESGPHVDGVMGLSDVNVTTAKLAAPDGNLIELLHFHSHSDQSAWGGTPYSTGFTHIALTVDNLDKLVEKLVAVGVEFLGPPQIGPDRYAKVIYAKGPEGVLPEFVELLES